MKGLDAVYRRWKTKKKKRLGRGETRKRVDTRKQKRRKSKEVRGGRHKIQKIRKGRRKKK